MAPEQDGKDVRGAARSGLWLRPLAVLRRQARRDEATEARRVQEVRGGKREEVELDIGCPWEKVVGALQGRVQQGETRERSRTESD